LGILIRLSWLQSFKSWNLRQTRGGSPLHAQVSFRDLALGVYLSGRNLVRRKIGAVVEGWSDPGTINLTPPGVEGTWEASASSRAAVMVIRSAFISRALEEHWGADSSKDEIKMQFLIRDPVIEAITLSLARETASGSPAGRPHMESGCEFLAHHLIYRYSSLSRPPPRSVGGLSTRGLRLVLQYIVRSVSRSNCARWRRLPGSAFVTSNGLSARVRGFHRMLTSWRGGCTWRVTC
jgi:hypothetical protein